MSSSKPSTNSSTVQPETAAQLRVVWPNDDANQQQSMHPELPSSADSQRQQGGTAAQTFRLRSRTGCFLKRLFDLTLAVPIIIFVLPPLCVIVKMGQLLQSNGPLMFRQTRSGRDGREFRIFKFRTMNVPPPGMTDLDEDPGGRIYPIGTFLRRSKLDEIPQFINVLLGSMSVVGPRPHHYEDCAKFEQRVGEYALRSIAKPGITGLAQYKEFRGDFEWNCVENRVARDLSYIREWSPVMDLRLIFKTVNVVLRKNAAGVLRRVRTPVAAAEPGEAALKIFSVDEAGRDSGAADNEPSVNRAA